MTDPKNTPPPQPGRADATQPEKTGVIQFTLPMSKKASYVKAAHREGRKLVPWMLEHLDAAASGKPREK